MMKERILMKEDNRSIRKNEKKRVIELIRGNNDKNELNI